MPKNKVTRDRDDYRADGEQLGPVKFSQHAIPVFPKKIAQADECSRPRFTAIIYMRRRLHGHDHRHGPGSVYLSVVAACIFARAGIKLLSFQGVRDAF